MIRVVTAVWLCCSLAVFSTAQVRKTGKKQPGKISAKAKSSRLKKQAPSNLSAAKEDSHERRRLELQEQQRENAKLKNRLKKTEAKISELTTERDGLLKNISVITKKAKASEDAKIQAQRMLSIFLWFTGGGLAIFLVWRRFFYKKPEGQDGLGLSDPQDSVFGTVRADQRHR